MMGPRILWAIVAGFLLGVFARSFLSFGLMYAAFVVVCAGALFGIGFFEREKLKAHIVIAVALIACALGIVRTDVATLSGSSVLDGKLGTEITLQGTVSDEPDVRENGVRIPVAITALIAGSTTTPVSAGILALAPSHTPVAYGDSVRVHGKLRLPEAFDAGAGRLFNYPAYLAKDGIGYELAFADVEKVGTNDGSMLKSWAIWIKHEFVRGLGNALTEPSAGLAGGLTVGDKRSVGKELSDTFRRVGLIHIIVLSGYNIMVVMDALSRVLEWMVVPRFVRFGSSIFVAIFFSLMTGGAAASVRASAMSLIAVAGRATGRLYIASRALGVVALLMVLWNPLILAFDSGFQLSILATAGLIAFSPIIAPRLRFITVRFGLREIAAATLSTQLAVLPLLLYQNGQLPLFSLPVNLLALVAVPWAMLLSAFAALAGIFSAPIAPFVGFPAHMLLAYIIGIAQFFGGLPFAALSLGAFSAWWLAVCYAVLFGGLWLIKKGREQSSRPVR